MALTRPPESARIDDPKAIELIRLAALLEFIGAERNVTLTRRAADGWYEVRFGNSSVVDPDLDQALRNAANIRIYQYTGVWE